MTQHKFTHRIFIYAIQTHKVNLLTFQTLVQIPNDFSQINLEIWRIGMV